jgi:hypothetical protein
MTTEQDRLLVNVKTLFKIRDEISILQCTLESRGTELEELGLQILKTLEYSDNDMSGVSIEIIKMFVAEATKNYVISK